MHNENTRDSLMFFLLNFLFFLKRERMPPDRLMMIRSLHGALAVVQTKISLDYYN